MPTPPTIESELVKALADEQEKSLVWARTQRREKTEVWREFVAKHRLTTTSGAGADCDALRAMTPLEQARISTSAAWMELISLQNALKGNENDRAAVALYSRAVRDARKSWQDAAAHEREEAQRAGVLVPVEQIRECFAEVVVPLGDVFRSFLNNVVERLPVDVRPVVIDAWSDEIPEWNRAIEELNRRAEVLVRC